MSRWPLLILVLLASALGLVACGGDDGEDADPTALLQETFGAGKEVKSGRLDLSVRVNAKGIEQLPAPVTVALRGPFESQGSGKLPHFDFEAEINTGGQAFTAGAVSTGGKGFLKFQKENYAVPADLYKQFKDSYAKTAECNEKQGKDKGNATFQALGIDPRRWLQEAKNQGKEDVGGAEAIHISSRIDVPKFLEDVNRVLGRTDLESDPCAEDAANKDAKPKPGSRKLTAEQRKKIAAAIKNARVDIWTGAEDKILRRLNVDLRIVGEGNKQSGDVRLDLAIGGLNKKQTIKAPSGAKPLDDLLQQFGGAAPGLGSGSQNETPAPGGSSGSGSSYEQCVAQAAGDVQKLQECLDTANQ
ncbi:MAG: hypothetical protein AVDCRST_MAG85-4110 [uncultured Solirubrobacteraceae bacterium]|uniref:Lipoprotein n=1 Tax=uncultured Solirubrobacteraceae bacterium TaxID=1162706 RepID=A0A6J4TZC2_9ACTN|nr:MAG: hypothetical protein AVDCRST_MAG85-4110 [uncultured Solirubrobacteraceae bacterium]